MSAGRECSPPSPVCAPQIPPDEAARHVAEHLSGLSAPLRVSWALENLPGPFVMSSSFGAQSAVMLHMVSRQRRDIPVILIDTGYLFAQTYQFIDQLTARLNLNLQIFRPQLSPAWQEARFGKRWEQGAQGIRQYNLQNKVQPFERALKQLGANTWFAGLRRTQATTRAGLPIVSGQDGRWKVHPIVDWSDRDIYGYLSAHQLPYHPLWEQGYISIGDVHTTARLVDAGDEESTRFFGLLRECGIHEIDFGQAGSPGASAPMR